MHRFRFAFAEHGIHGGLSNDIQKEIPLLIQSYLPLHCQLMAKAAVAQPSPSPSPTKLLEAKLLIARAEQKAKGKKKAPAKATKVTAKATKATKAACAGDTEALDVKIVKDDTTINRVSYIQATSISLMLL